MTKIKSGNGQYGQEPRKIVVTQVSRISYIIGRALGHKYDKYDIIVCNENGRKRECHGDVNILLVGNDYGKLEDHLFDYCYNPDTKIAPFERVFTSDQLLYTSGYNCDDDKLRRELDIIGLKLRHKMLKEENI